MSVSAPQFPGAGEAYWTAPVRAGVAYGTNFTCPKLLTNPQGSYTSKYAYRKKTFTKGPWTPGKGFITPLAYASVAVHCKSRPYAFCVKSNATTKSRQTYFGPSVGFGYTGGYGSGCPYFNAKLDYLRTWPGYSENPRNASRTKALANASGGGLNLLVSALEARSTAATATSLIAGALMLLRGIRHGKGKWIAGGLALMGSGSAKNLRPTKMASGTWLNYQYGWRPLLSDIFNLLELHGSALAKPGHQFASIGNGMGSYSGTFNRVSGTTLLESSDVIDYRSRTKLYWRIDDPYAHLATGLGLTNPALVAWELVPFSFVVDWFLPLGTWLEALDSAVGLKYVTGSTTEHAERLSKVSYVSNYSNIVVEIDQSQFAERHALGITRITEGVPPQPKIFVKNPFSTNHAATALSLLRQLRKR